ncbi:putative calcium-binding protein, partial [Quercus suber]
ANLFGLHYGLSFQGMKILLAQADINGDGVVDYEEFKQKIWNPTWPEQTEEYYETTIEDPKQGTNEKNIGFRVKNAVLFPWEVEKGLWPENYSLFLIMLHKLLSFRLYLIGNSKKMEKCFDVIEFEFKVQLRMSGFDCSIHLLKRIYGSGEHKQTTRKIIGHRFVWFRKGKMSGYEMGSKLRQQVKVPPNISKTNSKEIITNC